MFPFMPPHCQLSQMVCFVGMTFLVYVFPWCFSPSTLCCSVRYRFLFILRSVQAFFPNRPASLLLNLRPLYLQYYLNCACFIQFSCAFFSSRFLLSIKAHIVLNVILHFRYVWQGARIYISCTCLLCIANELIGGGGLHTQACVFYIWAYVKHLRACFCFLHSYITVGTHYCMRSSLRSVFLWQRVAYLYVRLCVVVCHAVSKCFPLATWRAVTLSQ